MPQKHPITKSHKKLIASSLCLVDFSVLELWWQKMTFWSGLKEGNK